MVGRITGQKEKIYERGSFGMKQRMNYSKRCLAVLLAILMLLAAAQPVSFVAAAGADPDPSFGEGAVAGARYTTSGAIELSFSEAVSWGGDIAYYVDFYDLDSGYGTRGVPVNENPVRLENAQHAYADTSFVSATISAEVIKSLALDMSHRISVAITAVDRGGWRSQPLEALVGDSLSIPATASSPAENAQFVAFENFEGETGSGGKENEGKTPAAWMYNNTACDEQTGNNNFTPANIDGVLFRDNTAYQTPGFNTSNALRVYMKNSEKSAFTQGSTPSSVNGYQRLDISYTPATRNFVNADELWIWVDTSYVKFDEFALQVRYLDRTGTARYDRDGRSGEWDTTTHQYSEDIYSTIGYAAWNRGARVPVYYQNENGLWDTMYTNAQGYLKDFGHYRGFLRVNLNYLQNEDTTSPYKDLWTKRPYTFNIELGWGNWSKCEPYEGSGINQFRYTGTYRNNPMLASALLENPSGWSWEWRETALARWKAVTFDVAQFKSTTGLDLAVAPINDIASVGITWKGASEDSVNKSFYIDQIGFSGVNMTGGTPVTSLTISNADAVQALVEQYLPSNTALINVSHASIISDLRTICKQFGIDNAQLTAAEAALENILQGSKSPVDWLSAKLDEWVEADEYSNAQIEEIGSYFNLYQTLTLGDLYRLGSKNEAKLIRIYNTAGLNEWYPDALGELYFKPFNDVESNYEIGQTALHEYDDYRLLPNGNGHYYDRAHNLLWNNDYKGAWENSKNLVAYSRSSYDAAETGTNSTDQRFSLASTSVGQNGFASSRSIDTSFYRDSLSNGETYRISLTHNGENKDNWDALSGVNIGQATDFIFYADFSEMNDIRKMWVTLRTENGNIYSHDEDDGTQWDYQILDMDAAIPAWKTVQTDNDGNDGCMTGASLNGFRGFIKIPLSHFCEITSNGNAGPVISANAVVKQIKLFYTGSQGGESPAGTMMSVDMFGFSSGTPISGFEQLHPERELEEPQFQISDVESAVAAILALYEDVTLLNETEAKTDYLFSYGRTEQSITAYREMLALYHTLTVTEKGEVEQKLPANIKMADMEAFVRNYDTFGGVQGNLKKYVDSAVAQRETIENAFQKTAVSTGPVVTLLEEYNDYPAKYQNAVLTYWADRNLHAVYPNFVITSPASSMENPAATMQLDADGLHYSGSVTLNYYAAVDAKNPVSLRIPSGVITFSAEDDPSKTIEVGVSGGIANPINGSNSMTFALSVLADSIDHAAAYVGSFEVALESPDPDSNNGQASNLKPVSAAEQYRSKDAFTVYVKLLFDTSYTIIIPADQQVEWATPSTQTGSLQVEDLSIPASARINVSCASQNGSKLSKVIDGQSFELPYQLTANGSLFSGWSFSMSEQNPVPLNVEITPTDWSKPPIAAGYQDVLTFNVEYQEK